MRHCSELNDINEKSVVNTLSLYSIHTVEQTLPLKRKDSSTVLAENVCKPLTCNLKECEGVLKGQEKQIMLQLVRQLT